MSPSERALAEVDAEIARRSAGHLDAFLGRADLSDAVRQMARDERDEHLETLHLITQALRIDREPRATLGTLFAFGKPRMFLRQREV